jgi:transcriptional regulator with XRE-family HTH domain
MDQMWPAGQALRMGKRKAAPVNLREIFGLNVRIERTRTQRTLEDVAAMAGTSSSYLSRVERGIVSPSLDGVSKIAKALNVSPAKLMDETLGRG